MTLTLALAPLVLLSFNLSFIGFLLLARMLMNVGAPATFSREIQSFTSAQPSQSTTAPKRTGVETASGLSSIGPGAWARPFVGFGNRGNSFIRRPQPFLI